MATWRRVLVAGLAVLICVVPVFARVDAGLRVATTVAHQTSVPLPHGDEMGDDELLTVEGEVVILAVLGLMAWGALTAWVAYENRDHPAIVIAVSALGAAAGGIIRSYIGGMGHRDWFDFE